MSKNNEFGPFGLPEPGDESQDFERYFRRLFGGPSAPPDVVHEVSQYPRMLEIMMELVSEKPYGRTLPILRGDFTGIIQKNDSTVYVDAFIGARRAYFRENQRKGRGDIPIEKHGFFVHTYAVSGLPDELGSHLPLSSETDISGYIVTAGTNDRPFAFFIETKDRSAVKSIHDALVEQCSSGEKPKSPEATISDFFAQRSYQHIPGYIRETPIIWLGQFSGKISESLPPEPQDETMLESKAIPRSLYRDSFEDARDYAKLPAGTQRDQGMLPKTTFGFHGYLESDRTGYSHPKFIDEVVSSFPGGVYVYTRAIGKLGKEREGLRSRAEIGSYMITVGLREQARTAQIYTSQRSLAHEIHLKIYSELQSDITLKPEVALRRIADEYKAPYDEDKIVQIEIK